MDFMAEYGSDSDDGPESTSTVTSQQQQALPIISESSSQEKVRTKQKRKLDVTFLPLAIQEALMAGANTADSDDDETSFQSYSPANKEASKHSNRSVTASSHTKVSQQEIKDDPLLRLLPPPKMAAVQEHNDGVFPSANQTSGDQFNTSKTTFTQDHALEAKVSNSKATTKPDIVTAKSQSRAPVAPTVTPPIAIDWSKIQTNTSVPGIGVHYGFNQTLDDSASHDNISNSATNRKRKERELEMQIQSGNLTSLDGLQVHNIQSSNNQWDALSYMDRQHKEVEIMNQYTNNGAMKSIAQPSKQQNRRHQLSSLALHAAETEIAMLEARNQRGKSKSQTQSKYGW